MDIDYTNEQSRKNIGMKNLLTMMLYYAEIEEDTAFINSEYGRLCRSVLGLSTEDWKGISNPKRKYNPMSTNQHIIRMSRQGYSGRAIQKLLGCSYAFVYSVRKSKYGDESTQYERKSELKNKIRKYVDDINPDALKFFRNKIIPELKGDDVRILSNYMSSIIESAAIYGYKTGIEEGYAIKLQEKEKSVD